MDLGHRARRLGPAGPRQAADDDGDARGGDHRHPRPRRGPAGRATRARSSSFDWTGRWKLPVWVAGYGPMALAMTGRVADGVILQLADPDLIRWFVGQVREAEVAAGRAAGLGPGPGRGAGPRRRPRRPAATRTRWFPALVSNHVVDLVNKYPREAAAGVAHRLHPRPDRLRLPPPRRGRLVERRLRRRRGDRPVLRPRLGRRPPRRSSTSWPRPASTSSTST